jgi:putative flippase GtrA
MFVGVGVLNAGAGYLLFLLYTVGIGFHYLLASVLVFVTWLWFGFELQRRLTFRAAPSMPAFGKYVVNQVTFIFIGKLLLVILVEGLSIPADAAYLISTASVTAGVFLVARFWVFGGRQRGKRTQ